VVILFKILSAPIYVQWEVTPICNHNCIHCYNHWRNTDYKIDSKLSKDFYSKIVSELISNNVFSVTVTGGEPLIVIEDILPFLSQLNLAGIRISINSNLSLMTEEIILKLEEVGVSSILVSLPSGNPETNDYITQRKGSFESISKGISVVLKHKINFTVNMVVTKLNLSEVFLTAQYVAMMGVKNFSATKATVPGNCDDFSPYALNLQEFHFLMGELMRVKKELGLNVDSLEFYPTCSFENQETKEAFGLKRSCSAGKTNCTIGFDGQIRPCSHAFQTYGNINDGLLKAWNSMDEWRQNNWIPEKCKDCRLKERCGGGCKIEAFKVNGTLNKPDPYCDFSKLPIPLATPKKIPDVSSIRFFKFNQIIKFREEKFGAILYVGPNNWIPVDNKLFQFAKHNKKTEFTSEELSQWMNVPNDEANDLLCYLYTGLIIKKGGILL